MSVTENRTPRFVRCIDNTLHRDLLTIGEVYEVGGEQYGNYLVCGHWLTKHRFVAVEDRESGC